MIRAIEQRLVLTTLALLVGGCPATNPGRPPDGSTTEAGAVDRGGKEQGSKEQGGPALCEANTASGRVSGKQQAKSCAYLGIPFAKPPVGALRWKNPEPPASWTGTRSATQHGFSCPQLPNPAGVYMWGQPNEDCLTLNVWTPSPRPATPAPVMVWINKTDGFWQGSSHTPWTDGTNLAERTGTILVTFDFRLGALGFLAHPALGADSGNYGFRDQLAALRWVKTNIAAFGGDPQNVTINGGGSHGAQSVCVHLVSPESKGLFDRAIMESGNCPHVDPVGRSQVLTRAQAETQGALLVQKAGCGPASDVAACLRAKTANEIRDALLPKNASGDGDAIWGPIIDGQVLTGQPEKLLATGAAPKVPLLLGTNKDEGTSSSVRMFFTTEPEYTSGIQTAFGAMAAQVLAAYPASAFAPPPGSTYSAAAFAGKALFTDLIWACPTRRAARAAAAAGLPTYLYQFTLPVTVGLTTPDPYLGTSYSTVKVFVFHTPQPTAPPGWYPWTFNADEEALSWKVMEYWARFAKGGDPNGAGAGSWPRYEKGTDQHLELGKQVKAGSALRQAQCDLWDSLTP